ncbi:MAG: energy-coupling factor transporter ATPase [Lachnospirales bacterium]
MDFIKCSNLSYNYTAVENDKAVSIKAIDNISFNIKKGEFVSIIGHNGSGKSTLGKILNGLYRDYEGSVIVNGMDCGCEKNILNIRKSLGMVFQNPDNQLVCSVVEDDVAFGCENIGLSSDEIEKRVEYALKKVGIYDLKNSITSSLSGGQKQRVAIAGIIAMKPCGIIFDESTSMLDPLGRKMVLECAKELNKEGITVIFITHYMDEVLFSDRIIVLNKGRIAIDGSLTDVFSNRDRLKENFIEPPNITKLSQNLGFGTLFSSFDLADKLIEKGIKSQVNIYKPYTNNNFEILKTDNISYKYPFGKEAVKNTSLNIFQGELIAITGATGSGKSTLIKLLKGLIKQNKGEVYFKGKNIDNIKDIKFKIGIVFQYPEDQIFESTVFNEVAFAPKNMGLNDDEIKKRVITSLKFVSMGEEYFNKNPILLSGGEKRRIAIASILSMKPEIIVFDEPLAGLDPKMKRELINNILDLKNSGITVIMSSHQMEEAAEIADRIIVMNNGEIKAFDTPYNIFSNRELINKSNLDIPKWAEVFDILNNKGVSISCGYSLFEAERILKRALLK